MARIRQHRIPIGIQKPADVVGAHGADFAVVHERERSGPHRSGRPTRVGYRITSRQPRYRRTHRCRGLHRLAESDRDGNRSDIRAG